MVPPGAGGPARGTGHLGPVGRERRKKLGDVAALAVPLVVLCALGASIALLQLDQDKVERRAASTTTTTVAGPAVGPDQAGEGPDSADAVPAVPDELTTTVAPTTAPPTTRPTNTTVAPTTTAVPPTSGPTTTGPSSTTVPLAVYVTVPVCATWGSTATVAARTTSPVTAAGLRWDGASSGSAAMSGGPSEWRGGVVAPAADTTLQVRVTVRDQAGNFAVRAADLRVARSC